MASPGLVLSITTLRHDAVEPYGLTPPEEVGPVTRDMNQMQAAEPRSSDEVRKPSFTFEEWPDLQIVAILVEQIKGEIYKIGISDPLQGSQVMIAICRTANIGNNDQSIEHGRASGKRSERLCKAQEGIGPIPTIGGVEADHPSLFCNLKAMARDHRLMKPRCALRQVAGRGGYARMNETWWCDHRFFRVRQR